MAAAMMAGTAPAVKTGKPYPLSAVAWRTSRTSVVPSRRIP